MNKEEILEKSRKENKKADEREVAARDFSGYIAAAVGIGLGWIIYGIERLVYDKTNFSVWLIVIAMTGTMFFVRYLKLKRKAELIAAIVMFCCFAGLAAVYIAKMVMGQ